MLKNVNREVEEKIEREKQELLKKSLDASYIKAIAEIQAKIETEKQKRLIMNEHMEKVDKQTHTGYAREQADKNIMKIMQNYDSKNEAKHNIALDEKEIKQAEKEAVSGWEKSKESEKENALANNKAEIQEIMNQHTVIDVDKAETKNTEISNLESYKEELKEILDKMDSKTTSIEESLNELSELKQEGSKQEEEQLEASYTAFEEHQQEQGVEMSIGE